MPTLAIESKPLRYVVSFGVLSGAVVVGTATAVSIPESVAYHAVVRRAAILGAAALGVYGMLRIEDGPGPITPRLRSERS